MNINSTNTSALNLIGTAQQKANEAAHTIATLPVDREEVGAPNDFDSRALINPILSMKQATIETKAAVKLLQADDEMKQSLLDVHA